MSGVPYINRIDLDVATMIFTYAVHAHARDVYEECRKFLLTREITSRWDLEPVLPLMLWTPAALCGVCRDWSAFCYKTPSVWSQVVVPFVAGYFPRLRRKIVINVDRSLTLSARHGIDVSVYAFPYDVQRDNDEIIRSIVQRSIWAEADRWTSFRVLRSVEDFDCAWREVAFVPQKLSRLHLTDTVLESWDIDFISRWDGVTHVSLDIRAGVQFALPLAQMVSLFHVSIELHHNSQGPGGGMLCVDENTYRYVLDLLNGSLSLRFLRIVSPDRCLRRCSMWRPYVEGLDSQDGSYFYPMLDTLLLEGFDFRGPSWVPFLNRMSAPNVRILRIDEPQTVLVTRSIISAGIVNLTRFSMTVVPVDPFFDLSDELISLCQRIVSLTIYSLGNHRTISLVDQLCDPCILPNLRQLILGLRHVHYSIPGSTCLSAGFDAGHLLPKLLSRRAGLEDLQAIVSCPRDLISELKNGLRQFKLRYAVYAFAEHGAKFLLLDKRKPTSLGLVDDELLPSVAWSRCIDS